MHFTQNNTNMIYFSSNVPQKVKEEEECTIDNKSNDRLELFQQKLSNNSIWVSKSFNLIKV